MKNVTIPDSVTTIKGSAFAETGLTEIFISKNVTNLDSSAFVGCRNLTAISVASDNTEYQSIDGHLYNKSGTTFMTYASGCPDTVFTIPNKVSTISYLAFNHCKYLTEIIVPASVSDLSRGMFYNSENLSKITIDANHRKYQSIDGVVYSKDGKTLYIYPCGKKDVKFTIAEGVTKIGEYAFYNNLYLEEIVLSSTVQTISSNAFTSCKKLTKVDLNQVRIIGSYTFDGCVNLKEIVIPQSVTQVGGYVFYRCTEVTVYCVATQENVASSSWDSSWNNGPVTVVWGYTPVTE